MANTAKNVKGMKEAWGDCLQLVSLPLQTHHSVPDWNIDDMCFDALQFHTICIPHLYTFCAPELEVI